MNLSMIIVKYMIIGFFENIELKIIKEKFGESK